MVKWKEGKQNIKYGISKHKKYCFALDWYSYTVILENIFVLSGTHDPDTNLKVCWILYKNTL